MKEKETTVFDDLREERQKYRYSSHHHCHSSGGIVWGLFLVAIGALFLLNNLGIVSWDIWNYIVGFWPIFLIFAGINVILGHNVFSRIIIGLIALFSFGLILIYGLYEVNSPIIGNLPPQIMNIISFMGEIRK